MGDMYKKFKSKINFYVIVKEKPILITKVKELQIDLNEVVDFSDISYIFE